MRLTDTTNDFIKVAINTILDGSLEKGQLINAFNSIFKEMYFSGLIDRLVKVSTCKGEARFRHEMSVSSFRSGLMFEVQNDANLHTTELQDISFFVLGFPPMIRLLKSLGFDTLVMKGKNTESLFYRIAEGVTILDSEPLQTKPVVTPSKWTTTEKIIAIIITIIVMIFLSRVRS